jgi:RNA recognition motif-containing protein
MSTAEEAKMAMDKLNGTELAGRTITVKEAKPQEKKSWNDNGRNNKW